MPPAPGARWLMWGIPALLFLIAFFHRVAPGVIAKDLMQAFNALPDLGGADGQHLPQLRRRARPLAPAPAPASLIVPGCP